jgi:hypothetical protein
MHHRSTGKIFWLSSKYNTKAFDNVGISSVVFNARDKDATIGIAEEIKI